MKARPDNRLTGLLQMLGKTERPVRLDAAAKSLGVSEKTVRRDISRLNDLMRDSGSRIDLQKGACVLHDASGDVLNSMLETQTAAPGSQEQRVECLAEWFLMNDSATLQSLADRLYISESTVKNDLALLKNELKPFDLSLSRCSSGLRLEGSEEQIRNCLVYWTKSGRIRPDFGISGNLEEKARLRLQKLLEREGLFMDEAGIANLLMHLKISACRIRKGKVLPATQCLPNSWMSLARELTDSLESEWNLSFPLGETENLGWHMAAQKQSGGIHAGQEETHMLETAITRSLEEADAIYGKQLSRDSVLISGLAAHLSVVLVRLRHDMVIDNPILKEIRRQYPYAMEIAQLTAARLQSMLGYRFPLEEVGFLAMHIGGSLVRAGTRENRLKAAVVCTSGMGTSLLLLARISELFSRDLDIIGTYTVAQAVNLEPGQADVVLSTVRLPEDICLPWLQITPLMTDTDIHAIRKYLRSASFPIPIQSLFREDLFFSDLKLNDRGKILTFLSEKLFEAGWIDEKARDSFARRESLGTTEIGSMLAVPHCMEGTVSRPVIAAAILHEPVIWEYGLVQVVLMIAVSKDFLKKENGFFLRLYQRLASPALIREFIQTRHLDIVKDVFTREDIL